MSDLRLTWDVARSPNGARLVVSYTVTNTGRAPVFLLDGLLAQNQNGYQQLSDRMIVRQGEAPGEVRFARGFVDPGHPVGAVPPVGRRLEPGETARGSATVALPLSAWHNFGTPAPLTGAPTSAVLEIGYLDGSYDRWGQLPAGTAEPVTVPQPPHVPAQQWLRSTPLPIEVGR
jgi:hypothetical protein